MVASVKTPTSSTLAMSNPIAKMAGTKALL
jgi:hypothetical protein